MRLFTDDVLFSSIMVMYDVTDASASILMCQAALSKQSFAGSVSSSRTFTRCTFLVNFLCLLAANCC